MLLLFSETVVGHSNVPPCQAIEIVRGCAGLHLVGCDLVEVSPAYDTSGNTSLTAANLVFEMLCQVRSLKSAG